MYSSNPIIKTVFPFTNIAQKIKFSIEDFLCKCDRIWPHLLKKSLMENFICALQDRKSYFCEYIKGITFSFYHEKAAESWNLVNCRLTESLF